MTGTDNAAAATQTYIYGYALAYLLREISKLP